MKLKLRGKILLILLSATSFIYFAVFTFFLIRFKDKSYDEATKLVDAYAREKANEITANLNIDVGISRSIAYTFETETAIPDTFKWQVYEDILKNVHKHTDDYVMVYSSFEHSAFTKGYTKDYGRRALATYKKNGEVLITVEERNLDGDDINSNYYNIKTNNRETLDAPYWYSISGDGKNKVLVTSFSVPFSRNNKYAGISGVDIGLDRYQEITNSIRPFEDSEAALIANDGQYVTNKDKKLRRKKIQDIEQELNKKYNILDKIQKGKQVSFIHKKNGKEYYMTFTPVTIGKIKRPWSLVITTPISTIFQDARHTMFYIILFGFLGILLIGYIIYLATTKLVNTIAEFVQFTKKINKGDLTATIDIHRQDELGELSSSLTGMVNSIKDIVEKIKLSAGNILNATDQLNSSSVNISQDANQQAANVEEVSSSMEEMASAITMNADNSKKTQALAIKSKDEVKEGNEASEEATKAMNQIAQKINIITDIAFQTNLLALNAAVEAARAGEHGKGFSVVAAEVRKLAERSKIAADEINELSNKAVTISNQAREKLTAILPEIEKTATLVEEITVSTVEQSDGANQINTNIQELNKITQANASSSEELASSAEELAVQAHELTELISTFKTE